MATLNETPSSNRLHIGVFGKTNSGKSSLINSLVNQEVSIVSSIEGTTTDPVYKPMEINPLGPCVIIDTAGFDDDSELGNKRLEKTELAAEKTDIAILVISAEEFINAGSSVKAIVETSADKKAASLSTVDNCKSEIRTEVFWYNGFQKKNTPVLILINKVDILEEREKTFEIIKKKIMKEFGLSEDKELSILFVSSKNKDNIDEIRTRLARMLPENFGDDTITGCLVSKEDLVLLVMPQDIQAPKGRLILPQVQTIRELLDKKCHVMCVTTDQFESSLSLLVKPPKLIIVDSQVFGFISERKPKESMLTSFSVLFAAHKGDITYYMEGAKAIDKLTEKSKVLIAECCSHAPLTEDIGRVKLPRMLRKRVGEGLEIDIVSGTDFPEDIEKYDLVIQCGACMFNRKYVLARIDKVKEKQVPMTNYGVAIAHLTGILEQVVVPN